MNVSSVLCLLMVVFAVAIYNSHGANDNQRKPRSGFGSQLPPAPIPRGSLSNQQGVVLPNGKTLEVSQLEEGLNAFSKWSPNDYQNIQKHKQEIIELIIKNEKPQYGSPINQIGRQGIFTNAVVASNDFTPCEMASGTVAVDGVFFLLGLMGLRVKNNEMITRSVMREMGAETFNGLTSQIHNFEQAKTGVAKAKALLPIMSGVYKAGGFSATLKAVKSQLSAWSYVKAGILMSAQLVTWFGTDGAAFVAEVAFNIMSAETLIQDSIKVNTACPHAG